MKISNLRLFVYRYLLPALVIAFPSSAIACGPYVYEHNYVYFGYSPKYNTYIARSGGIQAECCVVFTWEFFDSDLTLAARIKTQREGESVSGKDIERLKQDNNALGEGLSRIAQFVNRSQDAAGQVAVEALDSFISKEFAPEELTRRTSAEQCGVSIERVNEKFQLARTGADQKTRLPLEIFISTNEAAREADSGVSGLPDSTGKIAFAGCYRYDRGPIILLTQETVQLGSSCDYEVTETIYALENGARRAGARVPETAGPKLHLSSAQRQARELNDKGFESYKVGDFAGAAGWFRRALIHDPAYLRARINLASVMAKENRAELAVPELKAALAQNDKVTRRQFAMDADFDDIRSDAGVVELFGQTGRVRPLEQ